MDQPRAVHRARIQGVPESRSSSQEIDFDVDFSSAKAKARGTCVYREFLLFNIFQKLTYGLKSKSKEEEQLFNVSNISTIKPQFF